MSRKRPGRPKGSTNIAVSPVIIEPSRCPACGSSRRTKYENRERVYFPGSGLDCIAIDYRTCHCLDCGQARRDQERVYAPKGIVPPESEMSELPSGNSTHAPIRE